MEGVMSKQRGFTSMEAIMVIIGLLWLLLVGGLVYIAVHFISKFW
jgi:hypothetical protein